MQNWDLWMDLRIILATIDLLLDSIVSLVVRPNPKRPRWAPPPADLDGVLEPLGLVADPNLSAPRPSPELN